MPHELKRQSTRQPIDYAAAAEQLLAVLSAVAARGAVDAEGKKSGIHHPALAVTLARAVFGPQSLPWTHETSRRRIRQTATFARERLAFDESPAQIAADGHGYWLTSDPAALVRYAALRRRALAVLSAAADLKPNIAAASGQQKLPLGAPSNEG